MKPFSLFLILLLVACQESKKEESDVLSGGNTNEGGSGPSLSVTSSSPKFNYVFQKTTNSTIGTKHTSPGLPADGNPVIDASKIISPAVPTNPSDASDSITYISEPGSGAGYNKKVNALGSPRTHQVTLTESASSCSGPGSSTCTVSVSDDKVLDLASIDTSEFTQSTANISLTVNGETVSAPVNTHTLMLSGSDSPSSGNNQYSYPHTTAATFSGDYFYYIGNAVISGSANHALFRIHKTTLVTEPIYNPTQSLVTGGRLESLMAFNGKIYFGSRPAGHTDFRFLEYDTSSGNLRQISSSTQLLNPERFLVYNNSLYFLANNSGDGKRFYRMATDGTIYQLTNSCGTGSDIGVRYHPTSQGIYMALSNPAGCNNKIVGRLKTDDTFEELAYFASGYNDTENDGIGTVREHDGKVYLSAGTNYILFRDNLDGTLDQLTKYDGYSSGAPSKNFEINSRGIYWVSSGSYGRPMHYNLTTGEITAFAKPSLWTFYDQKDDIIKIGDEILVRGVYSTNRHRYQRLTDNFGYVQYVEFNTASNDQLVTLGSYKGENYYLARNAAGWKVWKAGKDGVFYQVSNTQSGSDFPDEFGRVHMTEGGFLLHYNGAGQRFVFQ